MAEIEKLNYASLMAFDYGTKRIGVAIGQTVTGTANPLQALHVENDAPNWSKIADLIKKWQPDALVVGIPYNMDGSEQIITIKARDFKAELKQRVQLPVYGMDERLTTIEARQQLFAMGGYRALKDISVDSYAAKIILEGWMQENCKLSI